MKRTPDKFTDARKLDIFGSSLTSFIKALHAADVKQKGCTVEFSPVNIPPHGPQCYGVVTWGMNESKRIFHTEDELFDILDRLAL